jgi:hypothetical protein
LLLGEVGFESQAVDVENHELPPLELPVPFTRRACVAVRRALTATRAPKPNLPTG